ncbi:GNAT domain-containing protein [Pseudomassariella vexata]|uniref:GNAT domain-domain-containing protein n=1 Tax=Pseudomassariella vexata TaxID=1141098 RepID=A0A1Y2DD83_9PEZI|nr:GNAT domain-containing protein [Pseudomassariella vexata]ORY57157.1 GNAT domain-domain-containing protein [Pseudomassariella vexata]
MASNPSKVKVKTTLPTRPFPPASERPRIITERLTIRPFSQDDLEGYHELRRQPEVMIYTSVGRIDLDLAETQEKLNLFLPPNDANTYNFAVYLSATGEFIGCGGVHKTNFGWVGWPEVGYMFKQEHWGRGYATEFVKGFVKAWWKLPRSLAKLEVDALSVEGGGGLGEDGVPEQLSAMVESKNRASMNIMAKVGFRQFKEWEEADNRPGFGGVPVILSGFVLSLGDKA